MSKCGQQRPALGYGGRPKRGHPRRAQRRPVPRPHSSPAGAGSCPAASPADNGRERPARSRATAAVSPRPPFPVSTPVRRDSPARAAPAPSPLPAAPGTEGAGRAPGSGSGGCASPPHPARPLPPAALRAAPRRPWGAAVRERGRAAPRLPGPAGGQGGGAWLASGAAAPAPRTSGWVPRRPCRCSRSPAGSDHARGDSPPSWMGGTRRPRRCGRCRGRSGRGARRGPAGAAVGFAGALWARGGGEEGGVGAGEGAQVAPSRAPRIRTGSAVLRCPCQGTARPGTPGEPGKAPPTPRHLRALVSGKGPRQLRAPGASHCDPPGAL